MTRWAIAAAVVLAAALALVATAGAGRECDGLDVCISVTGPWVVVPAPAASGPRTPTYYELRCPRRNQVVGGLDANVSDRAIAIEFLGALGSPVNPGITTSNAVVFVALFTGARPTATSFRPLLGCIPTSGGGRGTTSVLARSPVLPPLRRVRTVRLDPGTATTLRHSCGRGERLVSSSVALAFRRKDAPGDELIRAVRISHRESGGAVLVDVRVSRSLPASARAEVQIHAVCSRGQR